jgi:hypothetical protein
VVVESELLAAVDTAFSITARGMRAWPDPHPDRSPLDEEYSRLLDPAKWRIIGARADAWFVALVDAGVAVVEPSASVQWRIEPGTVTSRVDRLVPLARGALSVVVARSRLGDVADAGVTLGVGDPAVCVDWFPHCGCDACDSGSQSELDCLDDRIVGIISGVFRRLSNGERIITVDGEDAWSGSGRYARREVEAIIADPSGWEELSGASWLSPT